MRLLVLVAFVLLATGSVRAQPLYWVGLWNEDDSRVWRRTGTATPHMQAMERVAMRQCAG